MGRSNPTYRDRLNAIEDDWQDYRRALRRERQPHFDALFEAARQHADAAGNLNPHDPMHPVFVSMLLEQQRCIENLQRRVERLTADRTAPDADEDEREG